MCLSLNALFQANSTNIQAPKLPVRENDSGMVFVANLSKIPISSVDEFDLIYK